MHQNSQAWQGGQAELGRETAADGVPRGGRTARGERRTDDDRQGRDGFALALTERERQERWPLG